MEKKQTEIDEKQAENNKHAQNESLHKADVRLKKARALLREQYEQVCLLRERNGWQVWLSDHFYTIDSHAKQAQKDFKGFRRERHACAALLHALEDAFGAADASSTPLDEQNLRELLVAYDRQNELGERAFDFLTPALWAVLIFRAARAFEQADEALRERELAEVVNTLGRLPEIDFDCLTRETSAVEQLLLLDPAGVYPRMAEVSRRHYRHIVARIGQMCGVAESQVAKDVLACARAARTERGRHVGFHLMHSDPQAVSARRCGIAAGVTWAFVSIWLAVVFGVLLHSVWAGVLAFLPLAELTRQVVCPLILRRIAPAHLPRIEPVAGELPRVAVAVTTLLPAASQAEALKSRLEQLYFSNKADNLIFCLLADMKEDRKPYNPRDEAALDAAVQAVQALNAQYGERFVLFVRHRSYCKTQDSYCGWERKRGAIEEFIRFAKGSDLSLARFVGDRDTLARMEFLLTLDSDTGVGFDAVNRLVSVAMHPLNRPVIGKKGRVESGYGILSTRMSSALLDQAQTAFSHLMAGENGVSSYEQECGGMYQDVFGQTCFVGKGLINVEVFHKLLSHRLPENTILSHDILEGAYLRTGLVSDLEMTESTPDTAGAWFARLHRWARGDWQNLRFLGRSFKIGALRRENLIGWVSRLFLLENLRRSLTAILSIVALAVCGFGVFGRSGAVWLLNLLILLSLCLPPLKNAVTVLVHAPRAAVSRRFFCHGLPPFWELCARAGAMLLMAAQQAAVQLDAMLRSLWRMLVTKRGLLEWTTAAQSAQEQMRAATLLRQSWVAVVLGLALVLVGKDWVARLFGVVTLFYPVFVLASARALTARRNLPTRAQREQILDWCAQMFRFYETYANKKNHFLPPDNVQFSPVEAVARRTSPTNIGMMLLSYLAARDMGFLDSVQLYSRLSRVLDTIDKLEKWRGNLYNWYATDDLRVLPENFVSSVDSGNYLCALVALKEGILEYSAEEPKLRGMAARIEQMLVETDFAVFYNPTRRLFSIGVDQNGDKTGSHYDFLMSEARTASYYAIASRQAPGRHWRAFGRPISHSGAYAGPISWTGTMFEYFMPHLLLPVYEGSLLGEALHYALYCQKKRAAQVGVPWGISESGYLAVDDALNYQYKAHGVQTLAARQGMDDDCVVSPYSSFLVLPFDLEDAMQNLSRLAALGMEGQFGFYEAIDFTHGRAGKTGSGIVRSFMAHHVGMSIVACDNALFGGVMQNRFMRDRSMRAAREFLQEKRAKDAVVYEQMKNLPERKQKKQPKPLVERFEHPAPQAPNCTMLANGSLSHLFTDTGVSFLRYSGIDLTRRTDDLLLHPQGIFAVARCQGKSLCSTSAPYYQGEGTHSASFEGNAVCYRAVCGELEMTQRFMLERAHPVERCVVTLHNHSSVKAMADLLFYFEPVVSRYEDYAAHPAFCKLFMLGGRDAATDTITFSRRHRDGSDGLFLTVGLEKQYEYAFCLQREAVTPYPVGMGALLRPDSIPMEGGTATPDGCCAMRLPLMLPPHGKSEVTLLLSCAHTKEESVGNLIAVRREKPNPAYSPLQSDVMAGRLGALLLPKLLFAVQVCENVTTALADNTQGQPALWSLGISGDRPIVLFDWNARPDRGLLDAYLRFWRLMRLHRLDFDICVLGTPEGRLPSGVHRLDTGTLDPRLIATVKAAACEIIGDGSAQTAPDAPPFSPASLTNVQPLPIPQEAGRFDVVGGAYLGDRFYVERVTPLPFSHILANGIFGCLLQDASLGNSWWGNARECKLSPWRNDIATGNDGETVRLMLGDKQYDLCAGARASFSPADARYEGMCGALKTTVTVHIAPDAAVKYLDVTLENTGVQEVEAVCAYAFEPVFGVDRRTAKFMKFEQSEGCLVLHNPYNTGVPAHAVVHVPGARPSYMTRRANFYAGNWEAQELAPNNDPVAGTLVRKHLPSRRREQIRFILAAAPTREAAIELALHAGETSAAAVAARQVFSPLRKTQPSGEQPPQLPPPRGYVTPRTIKITTPSEPLDRFINTFAPHQIRAGRLLGRTAFYQCSGAYGFRDQLQDAGAYLYLDPSLARAQILRCCAVQFREGDVLHWWHELPDCIKGVRTRFSDDLLWLPLTVCDYIEASGDEPLLRQKVMYCKGEQLADGEQEKYMQVAPDSLEETVLAHCIRAVEHGLRLGSHGLALIGCGDWNDGFSRIGAGGKGESVWLTMFLVLLLEKFAPLCERQGESERAAAWRVQANELRTAIDRAGWDGKWYLRAFYDDGTPLGGLTSDECRIDLLSQSFAALCDMPDRARVQSALTNAMTHLVDFKHGIVKLFTPPFDTTPHDPGYIKAYPTGIRENGGQYTHAAVWLAAALLKEGRAEEGWTLLDLLNPTARCTQAPLAREMKTEPYYIAADIYTHSGCYGHGGWSIYTGAAAWYYRTVLGRLLGLSFAGGAITVKPTLPPEWNHFDVCIAQAEGGEITIECRRTGQPGMTVDGRPAERVPLDGAAHRVQVEL